MRKQTSQPLGQGTASPSAPHSPTTASPPSAHALGIPAGLRVQSLPTAAPWPVSLPATAVPSTAIWTSSPQSPPASPTRGTPCNSVFPVAASAPAPTAPKNISTEHREEEPSSPASHWEGTGTEPSPTSGGVPLTAAPSEHSAGTPEEASRPPTGSQPPSEAPAESPTLSSPQAPASSPPPLSTSPPEVSSASSASTNHSSAETSTKPTGAPTTPESPTEEHGSAHTPTSHATDEPVATQTTPQATVPAKVTCVMMDIETTASPGVIMQEVEHALSSGTPPTEGFWMIMTTDPGETTTTLCTTTPNEGMWPGRGRTVVYL
ncbi:prostate androgen-regulated mucin-like protein 1 isoform X2 [Ailuropoda melanoleuca]|uniref:prostate androgen-regulated mucin-like protein 1 isoform X2 n=1 Tax=Ailuropoda melanoleuca TaxID=9646 RepID=UPI0014945CBC|nr:prostate androgen-regulated mucin-like protein 1 isoform X2 [Ailuropoda melanoleuca]